MSTQTLSSPAAKTRVLYYDVLNICATLGVVFLHCNGIAHTYSNTPAWYQALFVEVFLYWPVPIFFMLSGATLMGYRKRYTTAEFFKKRFLRTAIPFVVWSLIVAATKKINPLEIGVREFVSRILDTSIENVYWFFIPLFAAYLAMPALSLLKDHRKTLWYLAGASFVLTSLLPPLFRYVGLRWNSGLYVPVVGSYLIFVILGYLFSTQELRRWQRIVIYILGLFGAGLRYGMTILLSVRDGVLNRTFFSYTEYYSVFLAVAVFVFFKHLKPIRWLQQKPRAAKVIATLSGCSFGVYLMHKILMRYLQGILPEELLGFEWRLFAPFVIYAAAVLITFLLKKIPVLKHIVP